VAHDALSRQRTVNELDEALTERIRLEQDARAGFATQARLIGLERRIANAQSTLRSCELDRDCHIMNRAELPLDR
jgi:hypothetical protein